MKKRLLCACLLMVPAAAWAAPTCTVTASGVAFGTWSSAAPGTTGTVSVSCKGGLNLPYSAALSTGTGTYAQRRMTSGARVLNYNLYTNAARTIIWGNGTGGTAVVSGMVSAPGSSTGTVVETVYGRYAPSPAPATGSYSDTIVVTLTF